MRHLRYFWRVITHRCVVCGRRLEEHDGCYHCSSDKQRCHGCNKTRNWGKIYGMGL